MTTRVRLLVGTKKGAFILDSDEGRRDWSVTGPLCEGWPVHDLIVEPGSGAILAAAGNPWYGPAIWRSEDGGSTPARMPPSGVAASDQTVAIGSAPSP